MSGQRIPFSAPSEPDDGWVATGDARISCDACGEWIYTRRRREGGPSSFPPECQVCGAVLPPLSVKEQR